MEVSIKIPEEQIKSLITNFLEAKGYVVTKLTIAAEYQGPTTAYMYAATAIVEDGR